MNTLPQIEPRPEPELAYLFSSFADYGLLWALNRCVLMPRGFAVALRYADGDPEPKGWQIIHNGDGTPFQFDQATDDQQSGEFEALLRTCATHGQLPIEAPDA